MKAVKYIVVRRIYVGKHSNPLRRAIWRQKSTLEALVVMLQMSATKRCWRWRERSWNATVASGR